MPDLEFYLDEEGNPCVRGEDERLATFIQTDLQGSESLVTDLIAQLEKENSVSEFNGNAHTLSIAAKTVTIEELLEQLKAWREFLTHSDASHT